MSKHTPGPWIAAIPDNGRSGGVNVVASPGGVPAIVQDPFDVATRDANARLIAAAPDLLAACKAIAAVFDMPAGRCDENPPAVAVRNAIAKATGEQVQA